ncbi:HigA family addiction module antitoxin [Nesterenkonia suensis]
MSTTHLIHPGAILREEFLEPLGITAYQLAQDIGVDKTRICRITDGERGISANTAIRLARYFQTTEQFWMNLSRPPTACRWRTPEAIAGSKRSRPSRGSDTWR